MRRRQLTRACMAKCIALLAGVFLLSSSSAHALTVTPGVSPEDLVAALVGPGITVVPGSVSYTGDVSARGLFSGGSASGLPLDSGIVLGNGAVQKTVGRKADVSPDIDYASTPFGLPGDPALDALAGWSTNDATILEFSFVSETGKLFFPYFFASEEYFEFANSQFNDVFGFFVNGVNIALIPGTNTPVSVNTINAGNPIGVDPQHPELFNANFGVPSPYDFHYSGFTDSLVAEISGLPAGENRIRIAISDGTDDVVDSAVFLGRNSFSGNPPPNPVPEPATLTLLSAALAGAGLRSRRRGQKA